MITDEMLCMAAERSCEIYVEQLQLDYDADHQHVFSLQFEKRIKKLKRRADHPARYRAGRRVAAILLVLLISLSTWLAVDVEARTFLTGWIKEVYETFFVYRFGGGADPDIPPKDYQLTWIPEGYTEFFADNSPDLVQTIYANESGQMLKFYYAHNPEQIDWYVGVADADRTEVTINGNQADLFVSIRTDVASGVLWATPDNSVFFISAFLSEPDLIKLAESVQAAE